MTDKTAAEMLRELLAGMTAGPWIATVEDAPDERQRRCRWRGRILGSGKDVAYTNPHDENDSPDVRGIVTLVNSLDEIAALVEAAQRVDNWVPINELDALTKKLREQLKGAGDE